MVRYLCAVLGLLILQTYVSAAPSNLTNVEETISKVEEPTEVAVSKENLEVNPEEPKLDSQPPLIKEKKHDDSSSQSLRQKRFYNFYGYGVPPINPVVYPGYNKRDQSADTGVYGVEDPLHQIQKRLQDIASFARQPIPPPPPTSHYPFFFPVIYFPQQGCDCNTQNDYTTPPPQSDIPHTPAPENNQTNPEPDKRFPDLSDERLNWGLVTNESDTEYDENEFTRPISFDPIKPNRPMMRPAPPVEHGSSQFDTNAVKTTTIRPTVPPRRPLSTRPPPQSRPQSTQGRQPGQPTPYPPSFANNIPQSEQPSTCDGAVLTCCHQPRVTYDCFVAQGCPDPTSYGNPCDPLVILQVIDKFQKFYGVRNG